MHESIVLTQSPPYHYQDSDKQQIPGTLIIFPTPNLNKMVIQLLNIPKTLFQPT